MARAKTFDRTTGRWRDTSGRFTSPPGKPKKGTPRKAKTTKAAKRPSKARKTPEAPSPETTRKRSAKAHPVKPRAKATTPTRPAKVTQIQAIPVLPIRTKETRAREAAGWRAVLERKPAPMPDRHLREPRQFGAPELEDQGVSPADLARELPVAESILRAYAQAVGSYGLAQVTGPVTNADGTVDAQVRVNVEGHDIDTVLDGMEHVYWQLMRSHRILESWWLRLGAQFEREGEVWRNYALDLFEGRETVIVNETLEAHEAAETWEGLRDMIFNVTNAYQSPSPDTGLLRPEYRVTHIIVRLHRGSEPPLY